jgi:hypothetical protein
MKIVVIGDTGLIWIKGCRQAAQARHKARAASPNSGVNTVTGEGAGLSAESRLGCR